jgi:hypothetical protein
MSETKSGTDKAKQEKLPSSVQQVYWSRRAAFAGSKAVVEVLTHYVGNNSKINIKVTDGSGKTIKKVERKITGNYIAQEVKIPADTEEQLTAEVDLPDHGLNQKSKPLSVFPPVKVSNAKWDKDTVRRGEILKLTADVRNFPVGADAMILIFEHDADGAHELVTKFPAIVKNNKIEATWEFEFKGDVKDIPRHSDTEKGYQPPKFFFRVLLLDVFEDSGFVEFKDFIRIELKDEEGNPIPNERYKIHLPDGSTREGSLDADAKAIEENLPAGELVVIFPDKI